VDNAATRRVLHEKLSVYGNVVYIDSSNGAVIPADASEGLPSRRALAREKESGWSGQVVCGEKLFFDSTAVKVNAANESVVARLAAVDAFEEHLGELFEDSPGESGPRHGLHPFTLRRGLQP